MSTNLLTLTHIRKFFGPEPVLADVTLELRQGEKIGLVGPNGAGKTTLLQILASQLESDGGQLWRRSDLRIGYMPQQPKFASNRSVWDEACEGLRPLLDMAHEAQQLAEEMARAVDPHEQARHGQRYDQLQHQLLQLGGYDVERRVQQVLQGLGFSPEMYHQSAIQLSGGQQSRLLLAQLLLASPDLLLLDEPSNHLDLPATQWLEEFLAGSGQALLIVSHDRYLLDRVTQHTLELFHGTVDRYRGNFSAYWRQKAERLAVQQREYDKQQEEIQRMEEFIRRNQYGQKHAQAEDRRKKLERMERVGRPRRIEAPAMRFPEAQRSGDIVLRLSGVSKSFQTPLFERLELQIQRGEKWGIFGRNGTGKTTLLRCIVGDLAPDQGRVERGTGVRIGYFDQRLEQMDENLAVVDAIRTPDCPLDEPGRRSLLARFGITGDMAFQPVRSLSGGERNRVALARLVMDSPNLLIMDEPTNHLDLWARDALESALSRFSGTVVLVSHDRYFLNRVVDHLLVLDERPARIVHGNYQDYLERQRAAPPPEAESTSASRRPPDKSATADPSRRRRQFPYRKVHEIEVEITDHEQQIESLQLRLSDPDVVRDPEKIKSLQQEIAHRQQQLATLYDHWEEAVELN